jgi:hypothetical protein
MGLRAQAADLDVITVAWTLAPFESAALERDADGMADFLVCLVRPKVQLVSMIPWGCAAVCPWHVQGRAGRSQLPTQRIGEDLDVHVVTLVRVVLRVGGPVDWQEMPSRITIAADCMVFIVSVRLGVRAACGGTPPARPRCPAGPTGILVSDEEGNVVSCCGVHLGPAIAEPNVAYTVIRRADDIAAILLGQLGNADGERGLKLGCQWPLR